MLDLKKIKTIQRDILVIKDESSNFDTGLTKKKLSALIKMFNDIKYNADIISCNFSRVHEYKKLFSKIHNKE